MRRIVVLLVVAAVMTTMVVVVGGTSFGAPLQCDGERHGNTCTETKGAPNSQSTFTTKSAGPNCFFVRNPGGHERDC